MPRATGSGPHGSRRRGRPPELGHNHQVTPKAHDRIPPGLADIVGPSQVLTEPDMVAGYVADFTGRYVGATPAVVRPASTAEVAAVVSWCRQEGVALTLQGGNTGLVGGGVPLGGEVVLSLRRLDALEIDGTAGQATAGAGVTLAALQAGAVGAQWAYGVDFASRDSATVGGSVATNAGGLRVLRYGDTRAQVVGAEAVLGTGAVISHLSGLVKDNTGYNLASLLCGSEGTLGVITAVRLRLVPPAPQRVVALLAFDGLAPAIAAVGALRREVGSLSAAELFFAPGLELVCDVTGLRPPFSDRHAAYLLVEAAGQSDPAADLSDAVGSLAAVADVAVGLDSVRSAELWRYREAHTEAINTLGPPHKLDVTLPASALGAFLDAVTTTVTDVVPTARVWLFGHAGDGNIHVNVSGLEPDDERVDEAVLFLAAGLGGSISAEHGIGTAKRRWLHLNRSATEIETFASIKRALDPDGILNPNVLIPPPL